MPATAPKASTPQAHLVPLDDTACRALLHDDAPAESLQRGAARSLDYLQKLPPNRAFTALDREVTAAESAVMLNALIDASAAGGNPSEYACDRLRVYRVELPGSLLVTGYYEPELTASRTRTGRFRYPLYRTPDDLVDVDFGQFDATRAGKVIHGRVQDGTLVPYYSRAEIDAGVLSGRAWEIAWLDDPVEAFFLHVQGSALLRFDDGVQMQVSYSSSNGRPYTSIGRVLVDQGKMRLDAVSLPALKTYLRTHPDEQAALMETNARYIFFRVVVAGPFGSLGVPLTAGRSIAADASVYPPGSVVFLRIGSNDAQSTNAGPRTFSRFAFIQDAGTAITGPNRIDVFWGTGATAEAIAGAMRAPGELYLVLPR